MLLLQACNSDVYRGTIHDLVAGAAQGQNCTIFAYGSTGSGKTHTMLGADTRARACDWAAAALVAAAARASQQRAPSRMRAAPNACMRARRCSRAAPGTPADPGLMVLSLQHIFEALGGVAGEGVTASYLEVYNEVRRVACGRRRGAARCCTALLSCTACRAACSLCVAPVLFLSLYLASLSLTLSLSLPRAHKHTKPPQRK